MSEVDHLIYKKIYPDAGAIFNLNVEPIEKIKENCIYVLDTNFLLTPYTTSKTSLKDITAIYKKLIDQQRLFIPGQVAREFAMNRPKKIKEIFSSLTKRLSHGINFFIDEYPLLEDDEVYKEIKTKQKIMKDLIDEQRKMVKALINNINKWDLNDPVSKLYKELFVSNIIYDTEIDEELINKEYEFRNNWNIPPGFKDKSKEINSAGDLIIWLTILKLAEEKRQNIIFVSLDEKSDWFHRSEKKSLSPRYELQYEFQSRVPKRSFHIIKLSDLLQLFNVNKDIIDEIRFSEIMIQFDSRNKTIVKAINTKRVIGFYYNGGYRTAEPFCYGISRKGNDLLRAFQTGGYSESGEPVNWKLFTVEKMSNITIIDEEFSGDRSDYNPNDSAMEDIYCCI